MGAWQRVQLWALRLAADVVLVSIQAWTEVIGPRPRRPVHHVPVGSALPDMRAARTDQRRELGLADETVVLCAFGTAHPTRLTRHIERAALSVKARGQEVVVLNLGLGAKPLAALEGEVRVLTPGRLDVQSLARWLAASDLYLAPFEDGVSTRRTTLMAALQHALPVVATDGPLTDGVLRSSDALRLVPPSDEALFAEQVCRLASAAPDRAVLGRRARELYERHFAWPHIVDRTLTVLELGDERDGS
jgi:glycosyltransferase involved in cell wall biosynthesis